MQPLLSFHPDESNFNVVILPEPINMSSRQSEATRDLEISPYSRNDKLRSK